jgi:hypothetical protein
VRENGVGKPRIRNIGQHGHLHRGHDLTGPGANHREAEDAIVTFADQSFHKAFFLAGGLRPEHRTHRQARDAGDDTLTFRFALVQSDACERRIGEHAERNQPVARAAVSAGQIVPNNPKVVFGHVGELRAAGAFADGPNVGRGRFQSIIHTNIAATVQLDPNFLKADAGGVGNTSGRDQDVAALDLLLAGGRAHDKADFLARSAH